jgi:sn-1 stearoyl-lipid 9-desaturase
MPQRERKPAPNWVNVTFIGAVHIFAILGIWTFSWSALALAVALWGITGGLGITLGFHRLLTHQSFETTPWLRRVLAVFGTLAVQGGPISWVATHRLHHAHSDGELDPHNSRRGFWWSHIGWMSRLDPRFESFARYRQYAKDLVSDRFLVFLNRWFVVLQIALGLLLLAAGGWSFVIWGIFVRLVFGWHCTWLVNSATHMWGYQTYDSRDEARNNWWVALLSFGEGWHNNHHAFPRSARHGIQWWELDMSFIVLLAFERFGWAWDLRIREHLRRAAA